LSAAPLPPYLRFADSAAIAVLYAALQVELGLKIEARKGTVETIVVDHVERSPVEN
jgi:uncharacterized protein (TIGR03435 family)